AVMIKSCKTPAAVAAERGRICYCGNRLSGKIYDSEFQVIICPLAGLFTRADRCEQFVIAEINGVYDAAAVCHIGRPEYVVFVKFSCSRSDFQYGGFLGRLRISVASMGNGVDITRLRRKNTGPGTECPGRPGTVILDDFFQCEAWITVHSHIYPVCVIGFPAFGIKRQDGLKSLIPAYGNARMQHPIVAYGKGFFVD